MRLNKREIISAFSKHTAMGFDEIESMLLFLPEEFDVRVEKAPKIKPLKDKKDIVNKINELINAYNM